MDRDEFVSRFKAKLDEWNADIDELETRAERAGVKARGEAGKLLQGLRDKRDAVEQALKEVGQHVGEAWHDMREGIEEAGEDLRAGISDARNRFKQED